MGLTRTTSQGAGVSLSRAKKHLELDGAADRIHDSHVSALVLAATKMAEDYTGRALTTQTWEMTLDSFPLYGDRSIWLPRPPLVSVTSITYVDSAGDPQTLDSAEYRVSTHREPAAVEEAYSSTWPTTRTVQEAVKVTFSAGFGADHESVPEVLQQAICLVVAYWFGNRGDEERQTSRTLPIAATHLLNMYRVGSWPGSYSMRC